MGEKTDSFLKKLIPKNIAAIIGLVEAILGVIREILMIAARVCLTFIPGDADDIAVAKIREIFDKVEEGFEKLKDFFLEMTGG